MQKPFWGVGCSFPLQTDARGQIELSSGSADIEQAIRIIISTRPGERVMRPTFGCRAQELLFEPRSPLQSACCRNMSTMHYAFGNRALRLCGWM